VRPTRECPGCGIVLPVDSAAPVVPLNASPECAAVYAEVSGFEFEHPVMLRYHQLSVDAYGAQHGAAPTTPIRLAYSLAGLWLALEQGFSGDEVRMIHRRMGHAADWWPTFEPPRTAAWTTVRDVAELGVRQGSSTGHATATRDWAEDVWRVWTEERPGVAADVERLLRGIFTGEGRQPLRGTLGPTGAVYRLVELLA
jgi:Family of unknown function (DUF5946)